MATPASIDITRTRGDTHTFDFVLKTADGTAVDITGFTFSLAVDPCPEPTSGTGNLFVLSGTVVDGPNGRVRFAPTLGQSNQAPGTYYYDLQMVDGAAAIRTVAKGKFVFLQDVTKT